MEEIMREFRPQRVAEMIHRELAVRLREDVKDPDLGVVSITRVDLNRDLSVASVYYLPLGGGAPSPEMREAVTRAAGKLRGPIGRVLRLRHAPKLNFIADQHTEAAFRVHDLLAELEGVRSKHADEEDGR
jgi:ribosome-binding factor A